MDSNSNYRMYENALLGILQNEGKIESFLDVMFNFLCQRTDFFRIRRAATDKMGFMPGVAQKMVQNAFKKYEKMMADEEENAAKPTSQMEPCSDVPKPIEIIEIEDSSEDTSIPRETKKIASSLDLQAQMNRPVTPDETITEEEEELDEDSKKLKQAQKVYQDSSESYNGAIRDNYSWSQNIQEVDVVVKVPNDIVKGKQVKVDMSHTRLAVSLIEKDENKILMEGDLTWKINVENSCWTLRPGQDVHINLEKVQERWWDALLVDEPKINIRNIDASRPMDDLGDEEQAKIHELMYNEHQKQLGKPTSEQMKIQNILKDAWDKDGSPFKGQPFDPSVVNIASSGDVMLNQP